MVANLRFNPLFQCYGFKKEFENTDVLKIQGRVVQLIRISSLVMTSSENPTLQQKNFHSEYWYEQSQTNQKYQYNAMYC